MKAKSYIKSMATRRETESSEKIFTSSAYRKQCMLSGIESTISFLKRKEGLNNFFEAVLWETVFSVERLLWRLT